MTILFDDKDGKRRTAARLGELGDLTIEEETELGGYRQVYLTPEQVAKLIAALTKEPRGKENNETA